MEQIEINPCPFCGNKHLRVYNDGQRYAISCEKCGDFYMYVLHPSEKTIVEAWNKRIKYLDIS